MMTLVAPSPCAVCAGPTCTLHHLLECGHLESEVTATHDPAACLEALGVHDPDCLCNACDPDDFEHYDL